jgi:hypothetical protein
MALTAAQIATQYRNAEDSSLISNFATAEYSSNLTDEILAAIRAQSSETYKKE